MGAATAATPESQDAPNPPDARSTGRAQQDEAPSEAKTPPPAQSVGWLAPPGLSTRLPVMVLTCSLVFNDRGTV